MSIIDEYKELGDTAVPSQSMDFGEQFFAAITIAGKEREDEITGEIVKPGKLQINGIKNNLSELHFVPLYGKRILAKAEGYGGKVTCSSFNGESGYPSGHKCGATKEERGNDEFCAPCRARFIVGGVLTDSTGKIAARKVDNEKRPVLVYISGKGVKYSNVSDHMFSLSNKEVDTFFPDDDSLETRKFEKEVINPKRFVSKATVGSASTRYGSAYVFEFEIGEELSRKVVMNLLDIAKKHQDEFKKQFDRSLGGAIAQPQKPQDTEVEEDEIFSDIEDLDDEF